MVAKMQDRALVLGASGFLGSHVLRALRTRGQPVRALLRPSSRLDALAGSGAELCHADVNDPASLRRAMQGCSTVYHCVVDTRAWLSDPTPLFRCNVEGLRHSMDAALETGVSRFVFTSTIATIGVHEGRASTEADAFNWRERAPAYVLSRVDAENTLLDYCRHRGLPGVALCVANTYGPADWQPTPHGRLLWQAATGQLPVALDTGAPCVDIRDAAEALVLAAQRGRIGERYIIAERYVPQPQLYAMAAAAVGRKPPRTMSLRTAYVLARLNQAAAFLLRRRDVQLCTDSILLSHVFGPMASDKARRELGWTPRPIEESVRDALRWFAEHPPSRSGR